MLKTNVLPEYIKGSPKDIQGGETLYNKLKEKDVYRRCSAKKK